MIKFNEQQLNKEEITRIRQNSSAKKIRLRISKGFTSLLHPVKLIAILSYITLVVYAFVNVEPLLSYLISPDNALFPFILILFKIIVGLIGLMFFLLLMILFGKNVWWSGKF
jgi:hypothetical protein